MRQAETPWIALVALGAMFLLPFLPSWLFEGPRTIKHHPRRHVCAECGAPWVDGHDCGRGNETSSEVLHGELRRPSTETALERPPQWHSQVDD
jgi:hypothetical protein